MRSAPAVAAVFYNAGGETFSTETASNAHFVAGTLAAARTPVLVCVPRVLETVQYKSEARVLHAVAVNLL